MSKIEFRGHRIPSGDPSVLSLQLDLMDQNLVWEFIKKTDAPLKITLSKWQRKRSLGQNSIFHAIVSEIARQTGMHPELIKQGLKEQYSPKIHGWKGELQPTPSSQCTVNEMTHLIEGAIAEAGELGIDVRHIKETE